MRSEALHTTGEIHAAFDAVAQLNKAITIVYIWRYVYVTLMHSVQTEVHKCFKELTDIQ
jgi:hypothetical protein